MDLLPLWRLLRFESKAYFPVSSYSESTETYSNPSIVRLQVCLNTSYQCKSAKTDNRGTSLSCLWSEMQHEGTVHEQFSDGHCYQSTERLLNPVETATSSSGFGMVLQVCGPKAP